MTARATVIMTSERDRQAGGDVRTPRESDVEMERARPVAPAARRRFPALRHLRRLRRLRRPISDYALLVEGVVSLTSAWIRLRTRPFRELMDWMDRPSPLPAPEEAERQEIVRRVSWAIRNLAERGPLPFVCFPQAIAARTMLHRRGVPVVLYYGVRKTPAEGFQAHVWVKDGETPVVGWAGADGFSVLHVAAPQGAIVSESGR